MKRWWPLIPLAAFAGIVVVAFVQLSRPAPAPASFISPVRPAPQFALPGLDGKEVKLADFAGRPVLVNFWATWCAPCKLEHPLLVEMSKQGVEIVGVLYKDPNGLDGARDILTREGNPFGAVALDPTGDLGIDFGLSGVPDSFLIDASGKIIKTKRNYFIEEDMRDFIAAYRAETAKLGGAAGG